MRQFLLIVGLVTGCVIGLLGYCGALIDWILDYQQGVYATHPLEAILETLALIAYFFAGLRFFKWRMAQ
ncbi:hypothetical protein [Spirosoma aerophilum]